MHATGGVGGEAEPSVLVAVPTYRREALLDRLLTEVLEQLGSHGGGGRVAVVDNDPGASAAAVAARHGVLHSHEPRPGIARVRQRALDLAGPDELLVMIDDDVEPEPGWLAELVSTWLAHRPTVVMGHVDYVWPEGSDPWLVAGGFFRRTRRPTGTSLPALATGNVLVDAAAVRSLGVRFDVTLGLAGGEDTAFGQAVLQAGGSVVACAESVVRDVVPAERATVAFVRQRTLAHGQARAHFELGQREGARLALARTAQVLGACARWAVFTAQHWWGRVRRDTRRDAVARRRAWFALGRLQGAFGRRGAEYARDTG
ncbi:glycosyltransferase family 2 protein [Auraticoccus monumenti]|uniref:Glycosyltransferase like family 2 n=1 Tax=Auraticoccus monumenti TaxID=675864 RepID=A0A1G6VX80_9ACTN|nr:glycosyltransferase [Auraticoccus monumenti]SDD57416.1 Glycosyltransferase like family 2 [Auraticoccus monumenti]